MFRQLPSTKITMLKPCNFERKRELERQEKIIEKENKNRILHGG